MNKTIVIADAILSSLMSKYKLVRKNPSREYFIADYNIGIIREHIDGIMTRKGSGVIFSVAQDKNGTIIPENDLDRYIYDIILILLIEISTMGFALYNKLLSCNPVSKVAIYNSLIPVVGAITSCLFLSETFYWKYLLAGSLAAFGIYIINKDKK